MNQIDITKQEKTHLDIHDPDERQETARHLGVTEDELRDTVRMFGSRIATLRAHLAK
ncbi:DUF3606 domain-containing protein [Methylobacterium crusticola]|uniref:DUF3606 domain-containing protein n=1 Tax=Methylobacterium crusticola TaxID=1697972 RepID=UPI000FFB146E|nr:DUF3606 domain-containing protein [Methylobacterium crusticola]